MKLSILPKFLLCALLLSACSIEINQTVAPAMAETATPEAAVAPQEPTEAVPATEAPDASSEGIDQTGRLIFVQPQGIVQYDVATGEMATLFSPPPKSLVRELSAPASGELLVITFAPPVAEGQAQLGFADLYIMPSDGSSEPELFLARVGNGFYFTPIWSPDGSYIYYGRYQPASADGTEPVRFFLERIAYPDGEPEVILENAFWPAISPDGSKIAYLDTDLETGLGDLRIANADGTDPVTIIPQDRFAAVDAPLFSPDGNTLIFSAVNAAPAGAAPADEWPDDFLGWLDLLFSPPTASAHEVPSDLWQVSVEGGEPTRMTELGAVGMFTSFSPDGQHLALVTTTALYLMNPDGSEITTLRDFEGTGLSTTIAWVP